MDDMDDIEPTVEHHTPTPADQLPRLPPRESAVQVAPPPPPIMEPMISVVVDTPAVKRGKGLFVGAAVALVIAVVAALSFVWKPADHAKKYSLTSAAAATQQIDSVRFEMDADVGGQKVGIKGSMDVKARIMQMDLDAALIADAPAGSVVSAYMDIPNLTMYMGGDIFGQQLPAGKKWVRMDLKALAASTGQDLSTLTQGSTNDPLGATALAANASKTTDLGPEKILNDLDAEHFQFEVNIDDALKAAGTTREKVLGAAPVDLPAVVVYDAWVDSDNHIRQMKFDLTIADQNVHYEVRYTEINPVLDIVLPTADDSIDLFDLTGA